MAAHTQLPIYKAAYDLLDVVTDLVKNMNRDFKRSIGEKISNECIEITVLVFRANVAQDKEPYLLKLVERLQVIELMIRLAMDKRLHANLNPKKTILQPLSRGVDFVGRSSNRGIAPPGARPWTAIQRTRQCDSANLFETANSYFGLLRQASHSHHDRTEFANLLRYRGHCIKADMTKTYRKGIK